ncbi:hypothetical protein BB561_003069 [Smittium simulii]|uniref:Uncharacterized protein n=1 Tax=Smittium simulii TaxID=133385 RepID=A0A2T9YN35_9FUNG|nr:hypothetical protein BB561_003069 [Smittium simulii]
MTLATINPLSAKFLKPANLIDWLKLYWSDSFTKDPYAKVKTDFTPPKSSDYTKLPSRYTRVEGWPVQFPENLAEYRANVIASNYTSKQQQWKDEVAPWVIHHRGSAEDKYLNSVDPREKAAIIVLVRDSEIEQLKHSIRMMEDRFNHKFNYPYIFFNEKPFTNNFIQTISKTTKSNTTFSLIPHEHWSVPDYIDMKKTKKEHSKLVELDVVYGGSMSYRHMCRYNSGFFYKHPLLQNLKYYWRLEPDIDYYCNLEYDPFKYMRENKKVYSFVIMLTELSRTIPTLWETTLNFSIKKNLTSPSLKIFSNENYDYNLCHFWSNFEIASLDWFRSSDYDDYFNYLDSTGKFFYERWGDAPVHSLAAGLLLNPDQIHFFNDIGYRHDIFTRWTALSEDSNEVSKCVVPQDKDRNFDIRGTECKGIFDNYKPYPWDPNDSKNALNTIYMNKLTRVNQHHSYLRWRNSAARN